MVLITMIGCATTTPTPKTITDTKQLVGSWNGWQWDWVYGTTRRVTVNIAADGSYEIIGLSGTGLPGRLTMTGQTLRFSHGTGFGNGAVELAADGARESLRFTMDSPKILWIECERSLEPR
jgi:hypothetical protein